MAPFLRVWRLVLLLGMSRPLAWAVPFTPYPGSHHNNPCGSHGRNLSEEYSPFPHTDRLGLNGSAALDWIESYMCHSTSGCLGGCQVCHYDGFCPSFNDCCPDASPPSSPPIHLPDWLTCPPLLNMTYSYFMVTSCPPDVTATELRRKCQAPSQRTYVEQLPVTDTVRWVSYRNKYCALCHGRSNYTSWNAEFSCSLLRLARALRHNGNLSLDSDLVNEFLNTRSVQDLYTAVLDADTDECTVGFAEMPGWPVRQCTPLFGPLTRQCNVTGQWAVYDERVERACLGHGGLSYGTYANVFCWLCNCGIPWRKSEETCVPRSLGIVSLAAVLDLKDDTQLTKDELSTRSQDLDLVCDDDTFLDPVKCQCRSLVCPPFKALHDGRCRNLLTASSSLAYSVSLEVTLTAPITSLFILTGLVSSTWTVITDILGNVQGMIVHSARRRTVSLLCEHVIVAVFDMNFVLTPTFAIHLDYVEQFLLSQFEHSSHETYQGMMDLDIRFSPGNNRNDTPTVKCPLSTEDMQTVSKDVLFLLSNDSLAHRGILVLHVDRFLICEQVQLEPDEFLLSADSKILTFSATKAVLPASKFRIYGTKVRVCLEDYTRTFENEYCSPSDPSQTSSKGMPGTARGKKGNSVAGILSFTSSLISLAFLLATLVVYALLKSLRTISGVCCMGMVAVLFLAQAVFEFGAEQTEIAGLCVALGVLAHYLWLSATFWMNACTVLMFYRLTFPLSAKVKLFSRSRTFALASLYAFLSPAAIVAASMAANHGLHGDLGYGGAICYIKRAATRRYGLALPIGILVVSNVSLFLTTVLCLRRGSPVHAASETRVGLLGCARLSGVTGLSWTVLFLFEAVRLPAVEYLAIVLFGLHGLVVFWPLLGNASVVAAVRARLGRKRRDSRAAPQPNELKAGTGSGETQSAGPEACQTATM